jgi:hypothetical protein
MKRFAKYENCLKLSIMKSSKKVFVVILLLGVVAIMGSCATKKVACPAYAKANVQQTQQNS